MAIFYHIDRLGTLKEGQVINLINYNDCLFDGELGLDIKYLSQFFNNGISLRGRTLEGNSNYIELIFELVRRNKFINKISRFEAFFGIENLEEVNRFKKELDIYNQAKIFEVECNEYSKVDMNLISQYCGLEIVIDAYDYWEGKCSRDPLWEILMKPPVRIKRQIVVN